MFERTCGTCGSTFEAKSRNAKFCSQACRPTHAQREAAKAKEWEAKKKAEKQREQEFLKRELPYWQGREIKHFATGEVLEGRALERYLVDYVW